MDAAAIHKLRKTAGLSQAEFALAIGASRYSVIDWEAGKTLPSRSMIARIEAADLTPKAKRGKQYPPDHTINADTHKHCFGKDGHGYFKTLAHPKWFVGGLCPLPAAVQAHGGNGGATVAELAMHTPLSPETVWQIFLDHNCPRDACIRFMVRRGHNQFGHLAPTRSLGDFMEATAGEGTLDDYLNLPTAKD